MARNNQVIMVGNVTGDVSLKEVTVNNEPKKVANYDIAVHTGERTDFFRVATWGKQAENDAKYLKKGNLVMVQGDLQIETREADGKKYTNVKINADDIKYLREKGTGSTAEKPAASNEEQF